MNSADSDKALDRFNLKVGAEVFNWVKDEQQRVRKETGKQPTQNKVMLGLIEKVSAGKSLAFESSEIDNLNLSEEVRKYLTMCIAVLQSGDEDALNAVRSNLRLFYRVVGGDPDDVKPLSILPAERTRTRA